MTRPVCEARFKAWDAMSRAQHAEIDATPDDMVRPLACLIPCDRPDGCGAKAGEECREPAPCPHCGGADGMHDMTCRALDAMFGGPMPDADRISPPIPPDATPTIDVSALLAERDRVRGILGARDGESVEEAAGRAQKAARLVHADAARVIEQVTGERDAARAEARELQGEVDGLLVERDAAQALVRELRDVVTLRQPHIFAGACPNVVEEPGTDDDRDNLCPACVVLMRADAMVGGAT